MRILITADLHYNIPRSRKPVQELAGRMCAEAADALVLAGDSAGADLNALVDCLRLFEAFEGRKFMVVGNHCLWCNPGEDSHYRYRQAIPEAAAEAGFEVLDHNPVVLGSVGLVGSIGWYDYSMRHEELGIPLPFYQAKVSPAAAAYYSEHHGLFERHGAGLSERSMGFAARWMDGVHVRLGMSDEEFLDYLCGKLDQHLQQVQTKVDRIVAVLHHLPTERLLPADRPDRFRFAAAYLGAEKLGEVLWNCPKVTDVYCGHSHWPGRAEVSGVKVVNVGSTYINKQYEVFEG